MKAGRIRMGEIALGVEDKVYEGFWRADLDAKTVTYLFSEPIDLPDYELQSKIVISYTGRWNVYVPYQLGAQMVNSLLKK